MNPTRPHPHPTIYKIRLVANSSLAGAVFGSLLGRCVTVSFDLSAAGAIAAAVISAIVIFRPRGALAKQSTEGA
jgi:phage baseplate assembly protein W